MIQSAYIHIPFCHQICHYCDFNKVFLKGQPVDDYLNYLDLEMRNTLERFPTSELKTIFIGGGTPTSLNESQLTKLLESIHSHLPTVAKNVEFTIEANPGDLSKAKLDILQQGGVNRLSVGVQSFNDELLTKIGRTHKSKDVYEGLERARKIGFNNISIDLIYSLPNQTIVDFKDTLHKALSLQLEHFSAYSLIIEPKTVFYNLMRKGSLQLPTQENEAKMYEILMDQMELKGYFQYEISNFSKPEFESRHNLTYWNNEEYYGFGAGAHGYLKGVRNVNAGPLKKYMALVEEKGLPYVEEHIVTKNEKMEEEMFLGLRRMKGVHIKDFQAKYDQSMFDVFGRQINENVERGLLQINDENISLTRNGKLLGNEVFQTFLLT
ncbi:radical SAM family heme chaperone HemW [Bacillus salitolerans]|uniref:Heme chaperone HemW n=1 Tax=Bacillus salitolerans TaxID=1437434 RepID=A0ABW4LPL2_9BACI